MKIEYTHIYSICTIVTQKVQYADMLESFKQKGFESGCEYLIVDNSERNQMDAYQAINYFLSIAKGKYIVVVHQDVLCVDEKLVLDEKLSDLTALDSKWAICGNAGANGYHVDVRHIDTLGAVEKSRNLPALVTSLDENLLIFNAPNRIALSSNIGGFHLYGTDAAIIANTLGFNCYVIAFMVKHLSSGNLKDLAEFQPHFLKVYGSKLEHKFVQTTCTKFYLSGSPFWNWILNTPLPGFFIKMWQRIKLNLFKSSLVGRYRIEKTKNK